MAALHGTSITQRTRECNGFLKLSPPRPGNFFQPRPGGRPGSFEKTKTPAPCPEADASRAENSRGTGSTTVQRCGSTTVLRRCGTMCAAHVFFLRWACFCSKSAASFILKQALDGDASRAENPRGTGSTTVQRCGSTMVLRCRGTACTARSFFLTMDRFRSKIRSFLYSEPALKV